MSSGKKTGPKKCFFSRAQKKCEKLFQNMVCFTCLSCQDTANTSLFGWFAMGAGSNKSEENTSIYDSCKNTVNTSMFAAKYIVFQVKYLTWSSNNNNNIVRICVACASDLGWGHVQMIGLGFSH